MTVYRAFVFLALWLDLSLWPVDDSFWVAVSRWSSASIKAQVSKLHNSR